MENLIPNIDETFDGVKYAYEKEGIYDTKYIASCIEHGEEFCSEFFAPSTYTANQLKSIGQEIAVVYGGECISVEKVC